jgi:hypothetical protein
LTLFDDVSYRLLVAHHWIGQLRFHCLNEEEP